MSDGTCPRASERASERASQPASEPAQPKPRPRPTARALGTRVVKDLRALATPSGVYGAVVETAWLAAHAATYPFGVLRERDRPVDRLGFEHLTLRQRSLVVSNVEAAGTPILLVHGMIDNRAVFSVLTRKLHAHGFQRVYTLNYSPMTNDIRTAAEKLAARVEELVAQTGYERLHIVGHSLGGLIARYYVQRLGGDHRVHTLVTLGTPHHGSLTAHLVPVRLGRQLRPDSDLFAELDQPAPDCRTRFVAFWSDIDQLIVPHENARLRHPDLTSHDELARGVGHLSLPINRGITQRVTQVLGELNSDGSALSAGVVPLHKPE